MTRLAIMSDLHIDLNDFGAFETEALINTLQELDVDHLHLAGDISNHFEEFSLPFVEKLQSFFPVTYNLGNHDMLGMAEADIQQMDFQLHEIGQKQLLAFHGWYDYSFYPEVSVDKNLRTKNALWFDRRLNRNLSDPQITQKVLGQLDDKLSQLEPQNTIVAMHFVPHEHFTMTHHALSASTPFWAVKPSMTSFSSMVFRMWFSDTPIGLMVMSLLTGSLIIPDR